MFHDICIQFEKLQFLIEAIGRSKRALENKGIYLKVIEVVKKSQFEEPGSEGNGLNKELEIKNNCVMLLKFFLQSHLCFKTSSAQFQALCMAGASSRGAQSHAF